MARPGRSPRLRKEVLILWEKQQQPRLVCTRRHVIRQQPCGSRAGVQPAGTSSVALNCQQPQNPRLFQPQPTPWRDLWPQDGERGKLGSAAPHCSR